VQEITLKTERKTQLVDITAEVRSAIGELLSSSGGGRAALVYVPHTTAGVTINEGADPLVGLDIESALEHVVHEDWEWKHTEDPDGPNAPSHVRATLTGSQVLIPLRDGDLALGRYQGIYFCEYDGPRDRTVYVTTLS
jgi:secondary thiamine-phosphate synthase enzyme